MNFKYGGRYTGTIKLRETFNGLPLKPKVKEFLDGKTMVFSYCWKILPDEKYPGEYAMQPDISDYNSADWGLFNEAGISWIASGDVEWKKER